MVQDVREHAREESEFWERRFDVPDPPLGSPPAGGTRAERRARSARTARFRAVDPPWVRALDWVRDRRGDPRAGIAVLVLVAIVAGFVWYRIGVGGGEAGAVPRVNGASRASGAAPPASDGTSSGGASSAESATSTSGAPARIVVHVAGAVTRPGVVELPGSARVIDAVEAVAGATADADLDRLNLAARAVDGMRIFVPKQGEADPGVMVDPTAPDGADRGGAPSPGAKVNLNTATQAELEALPGIGPAYAQAIIVERTRRGGFRSVNELREVRGIGDQRFADLEPLVAV